MSSNLTIPSVAHAKLPKAYEAARVAIEKCARIDECKDWADKSAAMASYAKQSQDKTLFDHAVRIQARAIKRCGELLAAMQPSTGGRPPAAKKTREGAARVLSPGRTAAAKDAGLSEHQKKTALRVAAVPAEKFEALVEAPKPATVTALAEIGTRTKPKRQPESPTFDPDLAFIEVRRVIDKQWDRFPSRYRPRFIHLLRQMATEFEQGESNGAN